MMLKSTPFVILCLFVIALPALAVEFEVGYPDVGSGEFVGGEGPLGWIRYLYFLAFALIGLAAFGTALYAGIRYMTTTNENAMSDAKDRFRGLIIGLLLAAFSVLLLQLINPELVDLKQPTIAVPDSTFSFGGDDRFDQYAATSCEEPEDCDLDNAGRRYTCDTSIGKCRVKQGSDCTQDRNNCITGTYCDQKFSQNWICEPKKGLGEDCEAEDYRGADCESGVCSSGVCSDTSQNHAPVIEDLNIENPTGPRLTRGERLELTIRVSDPDRNPVSIVVDWGDTTTSSLPASTPDARGVSTIVAPKTYGEARDWTITVTARDTLNGGDQETLRIVIVDY